MILLVLGATTLVEDSCCMEFLKLIQWNKRSVWFFCRIRTVWYDSVDPVDFRIATTNKERVFPEIPLWLAASVNSMAVAGRSIIADSVKRGFNNEGRVSQKRHDRQGMDEIDCEHDGYIFFRPCCDVCCGLRHHS